MHNAAEIRVGTTGDYPPLTVYDEKKTEYLGFDIDMAKNLGQYLHRKIIFVKTTWPTLEQDLQADKFDIAMGGIAITKERAQKFNFTESVLADEKVAIFNCTDKLKYTSLRDIDQPQIKVIENPGGTNERFARQHLRRAQIVIFADNTKIFSQLMNRTADVMITDSIEAAYQQKLHKDLCVLQFPAETDHEYKAYMLRKENQELLDAVNNWLQVIGKNNQLREIKLNWLSS